jgi:hypothetical protein
VFTAESFLGLQPLKQEQNHMANATPTHTSVRLRAVLLGIILITASAVAGCGSGDDSSPGTSLASSTASKSLAWDPVNGVLGYLVYYGTESPGVPGSCGYSESVFTTTPSITVTGLAPKTTYYFAVSAFNGLEGPCSTELRADLDSV